MSKQTPVGLYVLCGLLLLLFAIVYFSTEGFDSGSTSVPDICGTYGYTLNPGHMAILKQLLKDKTVAKYPDVLNAVKQANKDALKRQYTEADCTSLGGTLYNGTLCSKKNEDAEDTEDKKDKKDKKSKKNTKGKETDFSDICKGLNNKTGTPPVECNVNGTTLGQFNKKFTIKIKGTSYIIADNTYRFYTEEDCEKLQNGTFTTIQNLSKMLNFTVDSDAFLTTQGENVGFCSTNGSQYSMACASSPSVAGKLTGLMG